MDRLHMSSTLIGEWSRIFGDAPTHVRQVAEAAIVNKLLYDALADTVKGFKEHPHPHLLTKWLTRHENLFLYPDDMKIGFRFSRLGHRWRLLTVEEHTHIDETHTEDRAQASA